LAENTLADKNTRAYLTRVSMKKQIFIVIQIPLRPVL
jgi:hypothetical protein